MDLFQSENTPKNINYYNMKQLLVMMGFCNEQAANSDSNERVLLYDIWRILEGDQREEVTVEDVKTLLMGVVKITEFKRINSVPNEEEQEIIQENQIGFYNQKNQFCLRSVDLPIICKQFDLLYINRIQHLGKVQLEKKQRAINQDHSFQPKVNQKSQAIAQ